MRTAGVLVALFCLAVAPQCAIGQSTFGSLRGLTLDISGSAVPNTQVTLQSLDDNSVREGVSNDDGLFEFENLKPGRYRVTAHKAGFRDASVPEVTVEPRHDLRVNLTLSLASQIQTVEVSAAAEQMNTENGTIAGSLQNLEMSELPLNSRASSTSPLSALSLSPEVQQDNEGNISVGGATSSMVGYSVDGISTANVRQNGALQDAYPSLEGIQELKVTAFNNNAEFAQIGDVTFTTKSGTNQFHGSAFEYLQNDALDAKPLNFMEKAPKKFNTFGGSIGGPVKLPKVSSSTPNTFFYFDYEGNRRSLSATEQYLVPTQAERNGDFNGFITAENPTPFTQPAYLNGTANPQAGAPTAVLIDPATGHQFMGCNGTEPNVICNTRIGSVAQVMLNYYPLPNVNLNSPNASFNYETLIPTPSSTNGFDLRLDHNLTSKQQIYARFSWKNLLTDVANPLLPDDADSEHNRSLLVSYNYAVSPNLVNEFRFGFTNALTNVNFPILGSSAISSSACKASILASIRMEKPSRRLTLTTEQDSRPSGEIELGSHSRRLRSSRTA